MVNLTETKEADNILKPSDSQELEFLVGDVVVFIDSFMPDQLMTVHKVQCDGILLDGNRKFALSHLLRHASAYELAIKKRHIMSFEEAFEGFL